MTAEVAPVLALHGGAGKFGSRSFDRELVHLRECVEFGRRLLESGAAAVDVVVGVVRQLEMSGLYIAGRGASPNPIGEYELDACVMDGATRQIGAVAALQGFKSPITVARAVLDVSNHVLFAGAGAARFATAQGAETVDDCSQWFVPAATGEVGGPNAGTVGCVARDVTGRLAAATSTGGVFGKSSGRVGDSPLPGCGTWADAHVAVSCTGLGEYFMRVAAAAQVAHRYAYGKVDLDTATAAMLSEVVQLGGYGGCIAVDAAGEVALPFRADGMKRAALHADGSITVAVY